MITKVTHLTRQSASYATYATHATVSVSSSTNPRLFMRLLSANSFSTASYGSSSLLVKLFYLILLGLLLTPSVSEAQTVQWSRYTGHNDSRNPSSSYGTVNTGGAAIKRAADGSIYILQNNSYNSGTPLNLPTSDFSTFGSASVTNRTQIVEKYAADGVTLLWARAFATTGKDVSPMDLALTPSGEVVVMLRVEAPLPQAITASGWQNTAPNFVKGAASTGGSAIVLSKLSASGALLYGTYIAPTTGSIDITINAFNTTSTPQPLEIGADGTIYLGFTVNPNATNYQGVIPTTVGAFQAGDINNSQANGVIMIFNADNTIRYSTYHNGVTNDMKVAANGDFYAVGRTSTPTSTYFPTPSLSVAYPTTSTSTSGFVFKLNSAGQILASTFSGETNGIYSLGLKSNGHVICVDPYGLIKDFSSDFTTVSTTDPFTSDNRNLVITHVEIDDVDRLHVMANITSTNNAIPLPPTTAGAFQGLPLTDRSSYYAILDCNLSKILYATFISDKDQDSFTWNRQHYISDFVLNGSDMYLTGMIFPSRSMPVTATAYNDNGTAIINGYDVTPVHASSAFSGSEGILMKFTIPALKSGTNQITAPLITNICAKGVILPITGTTAEYIVGSTMISSIPTPFLTPIPYPLHYGWQISSVSNTGPWTDIANSDKEDYSPTTPSVSGTYFYRRMVRQTPFTATPSCVPAADAVNASNVISLTFSNNITHSTDILEKKYGLCAGSSIAVLVNLTPSADGSQGPYNYKLTSSLDLTTTVMGQSGSVASAPSVINLNINTEGEYILQVTDSRNCVSFDTLTVENFSVTSGTSTKFTCGLDTVQLGLVGYMPEYANFVSNTFSWSPTTDLINPLSTKPKLVHGLASGASRMVTFTFNGCLMNTITVTNATVTALPALESRSICQGDTVHMSKGLTVQAGVTYEWAPGLGLTTTAGINPTNTTAHSPIMTSLYAPQGVNTRLYYLKAENGTSGCVQYTTKNVTVYKVPNQSFQIKDCLENGCSATNPLSYAEMGTPSESGISYNWTVVIVPKTATANLPTPAQALASISNPAASLTTIQFANASIGRADASYQIQYIRQSFNPASPTCMRSDTAFLNYCGCGIGSSSCALALGALPTASCGGPDNKIGLPQYSSGSTYKWSRVDGQPLNNELFDPITKVALTDSSTSFSNQVIANPLGLIAIDYNLTIIKAGSDTCRIDIKVFPEAVGKPTVNYVSPQTACFKTPYTITGPSANPGLQYAWSPKASLNDTTLALPTTIALTANTTYYVTVSDATTTCSIKDTVIVIPLLQTDVDAGLNANFCTGGATVAIGTENKAGYTYQWTTAASGVTFANATAAITTATLPATAAAGKITLYLTATNTLATDNCVLTDSIVFTASGTLTVSIPTADRLCVGGTTTIGAVTTSLTGTGITYTWSVTAGPATVANITAGAGTNTITVNQTGTFRVDVAQGTCTGNASAAIAANTYAAVPATAPCASSSTIGITNPQGNGWIYSWDKLDFVTATASNFSTISVYPTTATTYVLTAKHVSGCSESKSYAVPAAAYQAILPGTYAFCEGQTAQLALNTPPSGGTVAWTANPASALPYLSSSTAVQPTINMTTAPSGTYTYTATVTYGAGCKFIASTTVNIGKKRPLFAGRDTATCVGSSVKLGTNVTTVTTEWSSVPADPTLTNIYAAQPTVSPTVPTTYTVKYFDASGCMFTDDVLVNANGTPPTLTTATLDVCQNATGTATANLASAITANTGVTTTYWYNAATTLSLTNPLSIGGTFYIKSASAAGCETVKSVALSFNNLPTGETLMTFDCNVKKGILQVIGFASGTRYAFILGSTYTDTTTYAYAPTIPSGGVLSNTLPEPTSAVGQPYTVRLFNSSGCFIDLVDTLRANACPIITTSASVSNCYDSNGNTAGGTSQTTLQVVVDWTNPLSNQNILLRVQGQTDITINPLTATKPFVQTYTLTADGSTKTVDANYVYSTNIKATQKIVTLPVGNCILTPCVAGNTGGTVWRDYNNNGIKEANETQGISGVTVKAYDCNGTLLGTTTLDANGQYTFSTFTPSVSNKIRLEFSGIPTPYKASGSGSGNGTDVRFVSATGCTYDFGVNNPSDYCQTNPQYVLPCYVNGTTTGTGANDAAVIATPYNSTGLNAAYANYDGTQGTGPAARMDALVSQVGSVWGEAYHQTQKHIYFGTFLKRHVGMADGPGYIYNFDYSGATPSYTGKFNLQGATPNNGGATIDLGTVCRSAACAGSGTGVTADYEMSTDKTQPNIDLDAFGKIGTMSLGDLEVQPQTDYLWAVNLYQKALIRVNVSSNPTALPTDVAQYVLSSLTGYPTSTTGILRPWALKFNDGKGYLGVVNDATISGLQSDLRAYVLEFDPNNINVGFTQVLNFDPNIKKDSDPLQAPVKFQKWVNTYSVPPVNIFPLNGKDYAFYPQAILSGIEFDGSNNMYLSFFDRLGHQLGYDNYTPLSQTTAFLRTWTFGELLKACTTNNTWSIEGTNGCQLGSEFFQDIMGDGNPESSEGSLVILKSGNQIINASIDPHPQGVTGTPYFATQGTMTYNLGTGAIDNWYSVFYGNNPLFGKANGLGDIELVCNTQPLEIGNYVWLDANKDGVQDSCEPPLSNIVVELWKNNVKVASTATTSTGNYYFSNKSNLATPADWLGTGADTSLRASMAYEVRIATNQGPLSMRELTTVNSTANNGNDQNDSDAALSGGYAVIGATTGAAGSVDHTLDFGFHCVEPSITSTKADTATCTNGVIASNAKVTVRGIVNGAKYNYGTNGTTGLFAANATTSTTDSIQLIGIANPSLSTTYTFRIYASDTTCYNDTTVILTPSVCPTCSLVATLTQGSCQNSGTTAITTDDYFSVVVSAVSSINGGTSGKYEVILNGTTVLNVGGTVYGTSVTVGGAGIFNANGTTVYQLKIRDLNIPTCETTVFMTSASAACSTIPCKPDICLPLTVTRN